MAIAKEDYDVIWSFGNPASMGEPVYDCVASFIEDEAEDYGNGHIQFDTNFNEVSEAKFLNVLPVDSFKNNLTLQQKPAIKPKPRIRTLHTQLSLPPKSFSSHGLAANGIDLEQIAEPNNPAENGSVYTNLEFFNSLGLDKNMRPDKMRRSNAKSMIDISSANGMDTLKLHEAGVILGYGEIFRAELYTKVNKKAKKSRKYRISKDDMCNKMKSESNFARLTKQLSRPFSTISLGSSKRRSSLSDLLGEPLSRSASLGYPNTGHTVLRLPCPAVKMVDTEFAI